METFSELIYRSLKIGEKPVMLIYSKKEQIGLDTKAFLKENVNYEQFTKYSEKIESFNKQTERFQPLEKYESPFTNTSKLEVVKSYSGILDLSKPNIDLNKTIGKKEKIGSQALPNKSKYAK